MSNKAVESFIAYIWGSYQGLLTQNNFLLVQKNSCEGKESCHFDCIFSKAIQESNRNLNPPTIPFCKIKRIYLGNMIWFKVLARKASMWVCKIEQTRQDMQRMLFSKCLPASRELSLEPSSPQRPPSSSLLFLSFIQGLLKDEGLDFFPSLPGRQSPGSSGKYGRQQSLSAFRVIHPVYLMGIFFNND